jgi:hypothetical protein
VGEGDQVREDQTGVRRGITVLQSPLARAAEVRASANGTSPRSAVAGGAGSVGRRLRRGGIAYDARLFAACLAIAAEPANCARTNAPMRGFRN